MTDCKHFPDQSNLFVPKNGRQQEFEPANSGCDTNPLSLLRKILRIFCLALVYEEQDGEAASCLQSSFIHSDFIS